MRNNPLSAAKIYASGTVGAQLCRESDARIIKALTVSAKLVHDAVLHRDAEPVTTALVQRWPEALPLFTPGYLKQLRTFAEGRVEDPRHPLVFAGDYLSGPHIEGAFTSGVQAAERLDHCLQASLR